MNKKVTFRMPDNWHGHLRQGKLLSTIVPYYDCWGRVLCMGNIKPVVETAKQVFAYRAQILQGGAQFEPVMCIMLTAKTNVKKIRAASRAGIKFVKFMPDGITFGSTGGIRMDDFVRLDPLIKAIIEEGMFLLIHSELGSYLFDRIPLLQREECTIDLLRYYIKRYPGLKITIEHVSTAKMINFIHQQPRLVDIAGTIAYQHTKLTRDDVFAEDGVTITNPYNFFLPCAKIEEDRRLVHAAMISGNDHFYLGLDDASHWIWDKEKDDPSPGATFGPVGLLRYVDAFDQAGAFGVPGDKRFERFTSTNGAKRYGFPLNKGTITVERREQLVPVEENGIRFCLGGESCAWTITDIQRL